MIYHFVVGDHAAEPLSAAVNADPSLAGEVVVLKDILHVGPLQKEDGQSFSELRSAFWHEVVPGEKTPVQVDDMERLLAVSGKMFQDQNVIAWFWMAPSPADVCAYYWALPYLSKHLGRVFVLNISGLPFLDDQGKLFYPKSIAHILPKELVKARKLARPVTPSEMEVDADEWKKLVSENAAVRTHEGGKKIISQTENYYDHLLLSFCSQQFQKASKIVRQCISKHNIPTGDIWLGWRLKKLASEGVVSLQGDSGKALNDFEVRLPDTTASSGETNTKEA